MSCPPLVRRALARLLAGALVTALLGAAAGLALDRQRFGADLAATRAVVADDVRQQFTAHAAQLERAAGVAAARAPLVAAADAGAAASRRAAFALVDEILATPGTAGLSLTIYGTSAVPLAWGGRPAVLPLARVVGPRALFLVPGPLGLRLVHLEPILDADSRRVGTAVAESLLPLPAPSLRGSAAGYDLATAIAPVQLRPHFEGAPDTGANGIAITVPGTDAPIAVVEVGDEALIAARAHWRQRLAALALAGLAVVLLLSTGPLVAWRRRASPAGALALSALLCLVLLAAFGLAWGATALVARGAASSRAIEAARLLLPAVLLLGLVLLAASTFERRYRHARRRSRLPRPGAAGPALLVTGHLLAGLVAAAIIGAHQVGLNLWLPAVDADALRFSLHPWTSARLLLALSLVVIHLAVIGGAALPLRLAWVLAPPPTTAAGPRLVLACWIAPALGLAVLAAETGQPVAPAAAGLALLFVVAVTWTAPAYRLWFARASQAQRLAGWFCALLLPSVAMYPALVDAGDRARRHVVEDRYAPEVAQQRSRLQEHVATAMLEIDAIDGLDEIIAGFEPVPGVPPPSDAAFFVWSRTALALQGLTSSVELYDEEGQLVSRFALNLPEQADALRQHEAACSWEVFEEVSPFFAEERRLLHAGRRQCDAHDRPLGGVEMHVMLDYRNLPFISAQNPYTALVRSGGLPDAAASLHDDIEFAVFGWSRRPLYVSGAEAWSLPEPVFARVFASRDPFWATIERGDGALDVYFLNDRGAIYALGYPRVSALGHLVALAELAVLAGLGFVILLAASAAWGLVGGRPPASVRALLSELRASFYQKLYLAFVLAAMVPVVALSLVTRNYVAGLMRADIEGEAVRTAAAASRIVEDFANLEAVTSGLPGVNDDLIVWLSRVVAQDVNIYRDAQLVASSERNLFASGLLSMRTPGEIYRALTLEGQPTYVGNESVGGYSYLVAAAPVRIQDRDAILSVPLTLRQREIERQIDELDRQVLLAALVFVLIGAAVGYTMAERIADPVNRLMRATRRIAAGDLEASVATTSRDELQRLVGAFNSMAAELKRQRIELERTNRLEAWADMARQVAHDIKNPLTPIQLNAEHLRRVHADRGRPLDSVLDECVTNILTQVRLLRQIAAEFSSFASSPVARPVLTALGDLVTEVVEPYRAGLSGRIVIEVRVADGLPDVRVDRTLVGRALGNVIENALHAMPGAGALTVTVGPADEEGVPLVVRDTGLGMDAEAVARIFEPYFSTKATGTGLGLTIARRNVELSGGRIAVRSAPAEGTEVTIRFPADGGPAA